MPGRAAPSAASRAFRRRLGFYPDLLSMNLVGMESQPTDLRTAHAGSTVVAEVAVAVADGDRSATVAGGGVALETGELLAANGRAVPRFGQDMKRRIPTAKSLAR